MDTERQEFGRYVLDLRRGCLLLDGHEFTLRPKAFAVLCYLAQHPNRLVRKDELLAAVWPDVIVTDDTLLQSIDELRQALGESGARLITTVPGHGYRFEADSAPSDRRKARGWHALRWRWIYGILAPLALMLTFAVLWLGMRGCETVEVPAADANPVTAVPP